MFGRTQRASVNKTELCLLPCTTILHIKIDVCFIHCSLKQIPSDFKGSAFLNGTVVKFIFIWKHTIFLDKLFFIIPENFTKVNTVHCLPMSRLYAVEHAVAYSDGWDTKGSEGAVKGFKKTNEIITMLKQFYCYLD